MTPPQRKGLLRLHNEPNGRAEYVGPRGLGRASWERMMGRLCALGFATLYLHGGFEITDLGRAAARELETR